MFQQDTIEDTYNMGAGVATSVNQLIEVAREVSQKEILIEHKEVPPTFLQKVDLDTSSFNREFGRLAVTSLNDGMARTYDYIRREIGKTENEE